MTEQQIKVVLSFLRIIFTEKQIEIKKPCKRKKLIMIDHFDDPSPMVLVFLDWFLMVYKPVNARGARSLNIFP